MTIPASVRRRWATRVVALEDFGDRLVIRPLPVDPIAAARGAFRDLTDSTRLRALVRADEEAAERAVGFDVPLPDSSERRRL